jgi:hypothetical protein
MNVVLLSTLVLFFLIICSSCFIISKWINFVDNNLDRKLEKLKVVHESIRVIKTSNSHKNDFKNRENKQKNTVIDVECEIISENNDIVRYL